MISQALPLIHQKSKFRQRCAMSKSASAKQLIDEILSMKEQYQIEVGSRRKPWPKSIKSRILELDHLGVPMQQISHAVKIPYQTIMSWRFTARRGQQLKKDFHSLEVKNPIVTVGAKIDSPMVASKPQKIQQSDPTVTVRTPDGYVLEIPSTIVVQVLSKIRIGK